MNLSYFCLKKKLERKNKLTQAKKTKMETKSKKRSSWKIPLKMPIGRLELLINLMMRRPRK